MVWAVEVVDVTGSTNADLVLAAQHGDRGPRVRAARSQTAGRGRLGRRWQSAPGASVAMSVLWAPAVPQATWTWLPVVVGLGVLDAVAGLGAPVGRGVGAVALKWPNDVVVVREGPAGDSAVDGARTGLAKLAGILSEAVAGPDGPVAVLGTGLNLAHPDLEPEVAADVTSLTDVLGRAVRFDDVLPGMATGIQARLERWEAAAGDPVASGVAEDYRAVCTTVGRRVRALTPGGTHEGVAVAVGPDGSLVIDRPGADGAAAGRVNVSAGDVEHVR